MLYPISLHSLFSLLKAPTYYSHILLADNILALVCRFSSTYQFKFRNHIQFVVLRYFQTFAHQINMKRILQLQRELSVAFAPLTSKRAFYLPLNVVSGTLVVQKVPLLVRTDLPSCLYILIVNGVSTECIKHLVYMSLLLHTCFPLLSHQHCLELTFPYAQIIFQQREQCENDEVLPREDLCSASALPL